MNNYGELRARYSTMDDEQLVEFSQRPGLTQEAKQVLDTLIRERNIEPGQIAFIQAQLSEEKRLEQAVNVESVKRSWLHMVISLLAPLTLFLVYAVVHSAIGDRAEAAFMIVVALMLLFVIAFWISLVRTARGLHESLLMWGLVVLLGPIIGAIVAVIVLRLKIRAAERGSSALGTGGRQQGSN